MLAVSHYDESMKRNAAFYERFAEVMRKSGKSQTEIAAIMGISQAQVNRILGGGAQDIKLRDGLRLCQALNIDPWFLAFGEAKGSARPQATAREIDAVVQRVNDFQLEVRAIVQRQAATLAAVDRRLDDLAAAVRKRRPS